MSGGKYCYPDSEYADYHDIGGKSERLFHKYKAFDWTERNELWSLHPHPTPTFLP